MRLRCRQLRRVTEILRGRTKFLRILLRRTMSPTIAHAGDRGSASSWVALPKLSRVDDLPMSAPINYGARQPCLQRVFLSFLDSRKSPVKAYEFGKRRHGQQDFHPPDPSSRMTSQKVGCSWSPAWPNRPMSIGRSCSSWAICSRAPLQRPFSKISFSASALAGFLRRRVVVATDAVTSVLAPALPGKKPVVSRCPDSGPPLDGA